MSHVLVVGAGLAGCAAALELSGKMKVTLVDSAGSIGGKVRGYGCKASNDKCANCGLCLAAGLWEKVENNADIDIRLTSKLVDLRRLGDSYVASLKGPTGLSVVEGLEYVLVATGFTASPSGTTEINAAQNIITGSRLEQLLHERTREGFFDEGSFGEGFLDNKKPQSVAFVQCYGSRDYHEHSPHCSRVCCGYSTRAAKLIKHFYPECRVVIYYMDLQMVEPGNYYQSLLDLGIEFVNSRPVKLEGFDMIVLSEGVRASDDARHLAEICGLNQDEAGFLQNIKHNPKIMPIGCVGGPKKIEETYAEAIASAKKILLEASP